MRIRRGTLVACLLLSAVSLAAPRLLADDAGTLGPGFHGLKWGDAPTRDMRLLDGGRDGEAVYARTGEALDVAGVKVDAIRYFFWKGRLTSVGIRGGKGFRSLLLALNTSWGAGLKPDPKLERYTWAAESSEGRTIAGLDVEEAVGFRLAIFSEELTDGIEVEEAVRGTGRGGS